jgi:hypothetical protein
MIMQSDRPLADGIRVCATAYRRGESLLFPRKWPPVFSASALQDK